MPGNCRLRVGLIEEPQMLIAQEYCATEAGVYLLKLLGLKMYDCMEGAGGFSLIFRKL